MHSLSLVLASEGLHRSGVRRKVRVRPEWGGGRGLAVSRRLHNVTAIPCHPTTATAGLVEGPQ